MDAFEELIAGILKRQGYWTWQGYKVELTIQEKAEIGERKRTIPRPEIDILAYKPKTNELLWVECKSYLNSKGVVFEHFIQGDPTKGRYKIFTDEKYRTVAARCLQSQLQECGLVYGEPSLKFWLVAGNIYHKSASNLASHFQEKGWILQDRNWIQKQLIELVKSDYENDVATFVAKLLIGTNKSDK